MPILNIAHAIVATSTVPTLHDLVGPRVLAIIGRRVVNFEIGLVKLR